MIHNWRDFETPLMRRERREQERRWRAAQREREQAEPEPEEPRLAAFCDDPDCDACTLYYITGEPGYCPNRRLIR